MAIVAKLPDLRQQIREMEERLKTLEATAAAKPATSRKPKPRLASPTKKPKVKPKRKS